MRVSMSMRVRVTVSVRVRVTDRVRVRVRAISLAHPAPRRRAEVRMPVEQRVVVTCVHGYTVAVSGPMGQVGPRYGGA